MVIFVCDNLVSDWSRDMRFLSTGKTSEVLQNAPTQITHIV